MSRIEVLEISLALMREESGLIEDITTALKKISPPATIVHQRQPLPIAAAQDRLITTGVAATANLLIIDSETCIRCGNCSLALSHLARPNAPRPPWLHTHPPCQTTSSE
jgi:hypothetical protein